MNRNPYPLDAVEFLIQTRDFSPNEVAAFIRLVCHQWVLGELPDDLARLERIAGCELTDEVLRVFPVTEPGIRDNALVAYRLKEAGKAAK